MVWKGFNQPAATRLNSDVCTLNVYLKIYHDVCQDGLYALAPWHTRLLLGVNRLTAFFFFLLCFIKLQQKKFLFLFFFWHSSWEKMEDNRRRKNKRADASKTGRRRLPADKQQQQQQQHQDLSGRQGECILLVEGKRDRSEKDHSAGGWRMLMRFWMETYTLL